ncbi:unnamed protein product [Miscanthus lutarioriparius]|uniref:Uncharacterized protein n=1 Tax=Miscanthus lutarioriparius TaxID=422564 RepID=A0A811Q673_9POAL|nr:unnamed protein product [Miscanthus lutarioriparius]
MRRVTGQDPAVAAHLRAGEVACRWWFLALTDSRYPSPSPYLSPDVAPSPTTIGFAAVLTLRSLRWTTVITGLRTFFQGLRSSACYSTVCLLRVDPWEACFKPTAAAQRADYGMYGTEPIDQNGLWPWRYEGDVRSGQQRRREGTPPARLRTMASSEGHP